MKLWEKLWGRAAKVFKRTNSPLTMERERINSILNLQAEIIYTLSRRNGNSFESLVQFSGVGRSHLFQSDPPTCGNTVQSWLAMFLSEKQIRPDILYSIISGGFWQHWWDSPNFVCTLILPYSWCSPVSIAFKPTLILNQSLFNGSWWGQCALDMCRRRASREVKALHCELSNKDVISMPRIFICSLSWAYQSIAVISDDSGTFVMEDHVLILIKQRCGRRFSIIQGYKATKSHSEQDSNKENTVELKTESQFEKLGMNLADWQSTGNEFSSPSGFNHVKMLKFLSHLNAFACNKKWDDENHFSAFHGRDKDCKVAGQYWPAFSFKEVDDEVILGWGSTPLLDHLQEKTNSD